MKQYYARIAVALSFIFSVNCITTGAQPVFQKHFSDITEYQELVNSFFDNSYVIASSTRDKDGLYDFSAVKTDQNGEIIWSKTFPSPSDDYLTSLAIAPSGDILLGGYKLNSDGNFDFSLMRIDAAGKLQWYKTYGTSGLDMSVYTGITGSGDIYIAGNIEKDNTKSLSILKLNSAGTILWTKTYSARDVNAATLTGDGGLVAIGSSYFMKISSNGTVVFTTKIQFESLDIGTLKQTSNGDFVFCGKIQYCTPVLCSNSFAFMRIDQNGKVLWSTNFKGFGQGKDVIETSDGGFAFAGQLNDAPGTIGTKFVVIKTDGNGSHLWAKAYGNADSNGEYACIQATADGGCMLLGVEDSKALLIKTDASGNTGCNGKAINPAFESMGLVAGTTMLIEKNEPNVEAAAVCTESLITLIDSVLCNPATGVDEFQHVNECKIFPNPFTESANVEIMDDQLPLTGLEFNMYDVYGRKVMQLPVSNHRLLIFRGSLPGGMYFYELRNKEKIIGNGKINAR